MSARVGKKQDLIRIAIRLPTRLHRDLEIRAKNDDRSVNYEIVTRLKASIYLDKLLDVDSTTEAIEMLEKLKTRLRELRLTPEIDDPAER